MASGYYDITNKTLGKGHFGVVKLGRHCLTGEPVAIKIIEKSRLNDDSLNQLGTEIRILFRLSEYEHPNILKLYQTIDTEDKLFLVTEYCGLHACDLHDYLSKKHRREGLCKKDAQMFFIQICSAISYCHSMGIVHRDLKPENILVTDYMHKTPISQKSSHLDSQYPLLKLIDFGFANQWYPDEKMRTSCGTLAYSAPELLLGEAYDGTKVDVWGLGLMLYILLYGGNPFMQVNDNETLTKILDCSFHTPIRDNTDIETVEFIRSLINRNPDNRLSIDEILKHKWFADSPIAAEPVPKYQIKTDQSSPDTMKQRNKLAPVANQLLPSISESGPLKNLNRTTDDNQVATMPSNEIFSETSNPHHNRTRSLSITRIHPKQIHQQSLTQTKSSNNLERSSHTAMTTSPQSLKTPQQHRGMSPIYRPTSPDVSGGCTTLSDEELRIHESVIREISKLTKLIDTKSSVEASLKNSRFAHRLFNQNSIQPAKSTKRNFVDTGLINSLIRSKSEQNRCEITTQTIESPFPSDSNACDKPSDKLEFTNNKLCNDDYIYATYQLTRDKILRAENELTPSRIRDTDDSEIVCRTDDDNTEAAPKRGLLNRVAEASKTDTADIEDHTSTKENENCPRAPRRHLQPQHRMRDKFTSFFQSSLTASNSSTCEEAPYSGDENEPTENLATSQPSSVAQQVQHEAFEDHNNETSGSTSRYFTSRTDLLQNSMAYALPLARKCSLVSEESGGSNESPDA